MKPLQIEYLADRHSAVPIVAAWYLAEWGHLGATGTLEQITAKLLASTNRDAIPLVMLAILDDEVVGAAELKFREMKIYPEKEHWIGGVFVAPEHRGNGIAACLINAIVDKARTLGVTLLHLQTERLDGGLYGTLGWQGIEQVNHSGITVLVMRRKL